MCVTDKTVVAPLNFVHHHILPFAPGTINLSIMKSVYLVGL